MLARIPSALVPMLLAVVTSMAHAQDGAVSEAQGASAAASSPSRARPGLMQLNDPRCHVPYPAPAVRAGAQGTTRLSFRIDAEGVVQSGEIVGRSGSKPENELLDHVALRWLSRCPCTPALDADGNPVGATIPISYVWRIG